MVLFAVVVVVAGCTSAENGGLGGSTSTLPEIDGAGDEAARLDAARVRWEAAAIDDYTWSFTRLCFCPPLSAEVEVAAGEVVREDVVDDDRFPADSTELDFRTMEDLFDLLQREIRDSDAVTVDYEPDTGQVVNFQADRIANVADDELGYHVDSFVPADERHPDLRDVDLTESYPCGYGFQGSNGPRRSA